MPDNKELAELHKMRLERQERIKLGLPPIDAAAAAVAAPAPAPAPAQEQAQEQAPFECPVCYTDGADSGLVNPACTHKVCVKCYSTVLLQNRTQAKCPCCRAFYLKQEQEQEQAPVPAYFDEIIYQGYPLEQHIVYTVNAQAMQRLNQINQIVHNIRNIHISAQPHQ